MSFMKNLLPTTLPVHIGQYHQASTAALHITRQTENLLIAMDLVTHPWDDVFLRSSLREISRNLWEESLMAWSYTRNLTSTVNDIHRGTATTINFNPIKLMTTVQNVVYNLNNLRESCMSFINVSHQLRYMSVMNMNILHRELTRLGEYIATWQTHMQSLSAIHSTYLQSVSGILDQNTESTHQVLQSIQHKEHDQRNKYDVGIQHVFTTNQQDIVNDTINDMVPGNASPESTAYESPDEYQSESVISQGFRTISKKTLEKRSAISAGSTTPEQKDYLDITRVDHENGRERHTQIVNMVRNRGTVSINDIAEHFPTFSRKTLQRDLSELIDQGKIIRSGDKRWALYRV